MAGNKRSGRTAASYALARVTGASEKNLTKETKAYIERLKGQAGARMFSVDRKYSDGQWFTVGTVDHAKEEIVGEAFGGGTYRLYELDQSEDRTGKPPLVLKLSPARWPIKAEYATSPAELERANLEAERDEDDDEDVTGRPGRMAGADVRTLAERIEAKLRREMETKQRITDLEREIKYLSERANLGAAGGTAPTAADRIAEMREMASLMRELAPPPAMGQVVTPMDPIAQLRESMNLVAMMRGEVDKFAPAAAKPNPMLEKLADSLLQMGSQAITAYQRNTATPAPRNLQGAPAGGQRAGTVTAPTKEQVEQDYQIMLNELTQRLQADQVDQLAPAPKSHISETATWIKARWNDPNAPTVWVQLREGFKKYTDGQIVEFLGMQQPQLVDSEPKKNWLASLVELIRKA